MLKNISEAKFNKALIPIAQRLMEPEIQKQITFDAYFTDVLLHEMAHGLGPGMITVNGRQTEVSRELKELYPAIEECKADIVGLVNSFFLINKGVLPKAMADQIPAAYTAGIFRAVRFGSEEAHGKGVLLAFNYLRAKGAITYNTATKRYGVNYKIFPNGVRELARELLEAQAQGSYDTSKQLLDTYGVMNAEIKEAIGKLKDLPVDIRPHFTILNKMQQW